MDAGSPVTIPVKLDEKTFKRFARYDMFVLRKRWIKPVVFSLILLAFSALALWTGKQQAGLIAAVLLTVGIGLPLVYFGTFLSQVNMQALKQKLNPPRIVYTVIFEEEYLEVHNNRKQEETLKLEWEKVRQAIRVKGCIYLYVTAGKAFLLPDRQADVPDEEVWNFLVRRLGKEKCRCSA